MSTIVQSHQDILNLPLHPAFLNGCLAVNIQKLNSLHTAGTSYFALLGIVHTRFWSCKHLKALENFCSFYNDLNNIEFMLLPAIQNAQALNELTSFALAVLKSKTRLMKKLAKLGKKRYLKGIKPGSQLCSSTIQFGEILFGAVNNVLRGGL